LFTEYAVKGDFPRPDVVDIILAIIIKQQAAKREKTIQTRTRSDER